MSVGYGKIHMPYPKHYWDWLHWEKSWIKLDELGKTSRKREEKGYLMPFSKGDVILCLTRSKQSEGLAAPDVQVCPELPLGLSLLLPDV